MDIETQYQATLEYLYGFVDYSLTRVSRLAAAKFDLERMRSFLEYLGHPERAYPILHIAGTKGKGSVAALCASALQAGGYRVGLYTSPHLQDYAERIQVDGQPIPHAGLLQLVDEIRPYLDQGTELTTFEITTALAFLYFARQGATAVVAEVGLGGRLDATNVALPKVSVITSLSYDHMAILGDTLAKIAGEKAGIIKQQVPVVSAPQQAEAQQVVEQVAAQHLAPLVQVGRDYLFKALDHSLDGQRLRVWAAAGGEAVDLFIPLLGAHQVENAAVAYAALQVAKTQGLPLSQQATQQGFAAASWPGRFEILSRRPPLVIDSAHNRDSAQKLRQALDDYFPGWPVVLLFGASEDKDIAGMFDILLPRVQQVIVTRSFHPRAIDPARLVEWVQGYGRPVQVIDAVEAALPQALHLAGDSALVLATGSIFVAAAVRDSWYNGLASPQD